MKFLKSLLLTALIYFSLSGEANCQVLYGVKGGLNLTTGKFKELGQPFDAHYALRYHLGFLTQIPVSEKLYLRPELLYSQKGWKEPANDWIDNVSVTLTYLNLPVLIGYRVSGDLSLFAGPELGYKLNFNNDNPGSWPNLYEKTDLGLTAGASYSLAPKLAIDLRYAHGLKALAKVDLVDEDGNKSGEITDGSNRAFQLGISYFLCRRE